MIQSLLITILAVLSVGCATQKAGTLDTTQHSFVKTYKVFGTFGAKRIFLTHGIWGDDTQYNGGGLLELRDGLVANGYQVITFSYPYTQNSILADAGLAYRNEYLAFLQWLINDTDARFGTAVELDIGGFSFGGLHAIVGAANLPFDRYLAMLPVTNLTATKLLGAQPDDYFNAFKESPALMGKRGMVITSHNDTVLGFQNAMDFAAQVAADYHDYSPGDGHAVNSAMVQDILASF